MVVVPGVENLALLAGGNNGSVYSGVESGLDRLVAVKVMRSGIDGGERRFNREVKAMGRLSRIDGVAPIYRTGVLSDGQPFLVMPLFDGSLQDAVSAHGPAQVAPAAAAVRRAAQAMAQAHELGVLHLDLKPSNLLLDKNGTVFIADFGIAEFTDASASMSGAMLTPQYAPPERFKDTKATPASDVYSLGATLFALLTGQPPFKTEENTGPAAVMLRIIQDPVPIEALPYTVPPQIRNAISSAMAKDPTRRPTALEFASMLDDSPLATRAAPGTPTINDHWAGANDPTVLRDARPTAPNHHNDNPTVLRGPPNAVGPPPVADKTKRNLIIAGLLAVTALITLIAVGTLNRINSTESAATSTTSEEPTTTTQAPATTTSTTTTQAPATTARQIEVSVFDLRAGDCIVGDVGAGKVTRLEKVDCDAEHQFEVYREALIEDSIVDFDEPAISAYAEDACRTSLAAYIPAEDDRNLRFKFLQPTEDSWNQAEDPDRVITCLLFDGDGDPLVGRAN